LEGHQNHRQARVEQVVSEIRFQKALEVRVVSILLCCSLQMALEALAVGCQR